MGETIDYERVKQTDAGIKRMQIMQYNPKFETEKGGFVVVVKFFSSAQQFWKSSCCGLRENRPHNIFVLFQINCGLPSRPVRY
jgi:hypothetical protein